MSLRTTFFLMVVFLGLGSFAFFDPFSLKEKRRESAEQGEKVIPMKGKLLEEIRVPAKNLVLQCSKSEGCVPDGTATWRLEAPVKDGGDSASIGSLTSSLLNLTHQEKIDFETPPDPQEFGLEKGIQLELKLKGESAPLVLRFGGATAVGPNVYLSTSLQPLRLYVVPKYFSDMVEKDSFHWREKRLFPKAIPETVAGLQWEGKSSVRAKKSGSSWVLENPVSGAADPIMFEGLVSTVVFASAQRIFSEKRDSPEAVKLLASKPVLKIQLVSEGSSSLSLYQTKSPSIYAAAVDGKEAIFELEKTPFERFLKPLLEYRERRLFPALDRVSVREMEFFFPKENKKISLRESGGQWVFSAGDTPKEALSQERLSGVLDTIFESRAVTFHPPLSQAVGLLAKQTADLELTLKGDSSSEKAKFLVMERKYALTDGGKDVRSFGEDLLRLLPVRLSDLYQSNNKQVVPEMKKEDHGKRFNNPHQGHAH